MVSCDADDDGGWQSRTIIIIGITQHHSISSPSSSPSINDIKIHHYDDDDAGADYEL
jgi:hypothetical protein